MKKNFRFAFVGAIALLGAVGLSSCSSSSDEVIDNPNYNPETNTVKTEFTISLPNYVGASTRQTDAITQAQSNPVFRGLQDMVLIPYGAAVETTSTPLQSKVFNQLGTISAFGTDEGTYAPQNAKVYKTLDVPGGSKVFMFYGQATTTGTTPADYFRDGVIKAPTSFAGAASTYNFSLQPICSDYSNSATYDVKGNAIIDYIKGIRATAVSTPTLGSLLSSFKPTAASSASIQAAVQKLWNQVIDANNAFPVTDQNLVKASIEGTSNAYATVSTENIVTMTASTNLTGYPANLNLPDGAVTINWTDTTNPVINGSVGLDVTDLTKFVYPAALYYRANSTIGVSTTDEVSKTFGDATWQTIIGGSTYYTWNGTVDGNTRSIALHDQIQYAVGRLDLSVIAANATLYDADGSPVTVNSTNGFPISAVLIGGQKDVGYDFTPNGTVSYTIYDKIMNGTVAAKAGSTVGVNRTLVLETAATGANTVNVAVEMTNNTGTVFRGKDGDVPINGKFYLIGTLDLTKAGEITQPTVARTKIFEQDYVTTANFTISQGVDAATLAGTPGSKNTTGLGAAYNVLPDLTVSNLEVAFSVDLSWTPGLTFTVNM